MEWMNYSANISYSNIWLSGYSLHFIIAMHSSITIDCNTGSKSERVKESKHPSLEYITEQTDFKLMFTYQMHCIACE